MSVGSVVDERPADVDAPADGEGGSQLALRVEGLVKRYGGITALEGVDLTVRVGEVHALLGQNGCGKSTLVKSLTGVVTPDGGEVTLFGTPLEFPVADATRAGIAVIHQDIGLVDDMTVLENLGVVARYGTRLLGRVNERKERAIYERIMTTFGVEFDLDAKVASLSPAERALLAIVRAQRLLNSEDGRSLFILDEPTAALSRPEAQRILQLMRRVADLGNAVIFISHRLQEVMDVCDRATVMRAGSRVAEFDVEDVTRADLVSSMLGRRLDDFFPAPPAFTAAEPRFTARGVSGERVKDFHVAVAAGEVVGVTGLAGMGQEELPFLLAGAAPLREGELTLGGLEHRFRTPAEAIAAGVALVPAARLRDGVWSAGTAEENVTLPVVGSFSSLFGIRQAGLRERAAALMADVNVHPNEPQLPLSAFSGGNQQKIVFAKWLQLQPKVLLLDEPTQGVDPGSAKELLSDAMAIAEGGAAVIVFSGDHEQLAEICHRVIVLQHGEQVAELSGDQLTEQRLLEACESEPRAAA